LFVEHCMRHKPQKPPTPKRLPAQVDDCPCTQVRCHRHGNCVECIRVHRTRQEHLPECLQEMFRVRIKELAALVEYDIRDLRRTPAYWDERLGTEPPQSPRPYRKHPAKKRSGRQRVKSRK